MIKNYLLSVCFLAISAPLFAQDEHSVQWRYESETSSAMFLLDVLPLADRGYVMVNGAITLAGTGRDLLANPQVRAAYLEGGH